MKKCFLVFVLLMVMFGGSNPVQASTKYESDLYMVNSFSWKLFREPETDDDKNYFDKDKEVDKDFKEDDEKHGGNDGVTLVDDYCSNDDFKKPFIFIGKIFSIIKILIPILIIIFGVIDLFKAVIGSKDDEIKKSVRSLMFRAIAGVVIFFVPTIIHLVFLLIDDWQSYETTYSKCSLCITSPNKCKNDQTSNEEKS